MHVLLVDDDPFAVQIMQHVLGRSEAGDDVKVLMSGEEALDLLSSFGTNMTADLPRLILVDYHMPNVSGLEVVKAVRTNPAVKATPVVMMSGVEDDEQRSKSIAAGASDFFVKPINFDEFEKLLDVVRTFLRGDLPAQNANLG